jgi:hypothetical protein
MLTIPQEYVGLANVVGDCYCFGLAVHLKIPIYKYVPVLINGICSGWWQRPPLMVIS